MENDYITSLAQVSCEEQFTEDFSREYEQWIDEREQEWERTMAYADNNL
mgnify:CR=1 FL=1|tara:strand:- start:805 stop:951 length:147 start_codon:yes stop_codon:yes gene_type:complete